MTDAQIYSMNKGKQTAYQMTWGAGPEVLRVVVEQGKPNRVQVKSSSESNDWTLFLNRGNKKIIARVKEILAS